MPAYISEITYKGGSATDFVEIAVPTGTDMSGYTIQIYGSDGLLIQSYSLGSVQNTIAGKDVYVVDQSANPGFVIESTDAVAFVDDTGTVQQFVSFKDVTITAADGDANGMTSESIGASKDGESLESNDGGATYSAQTSPNAGTVPCYVPGTMIDTPNGPSAVEDLLPGDLVLTANHGPQPIRWVRSGDHPLEDTEVDNMPVLIQAGALGPNRPAQDLIVSPQHRILVGGAGQLTRYFDKAAFAPAKALTKLAGIRHMLGKAKITWIHFACDQHEVVTANGCLSESLLLGPMVVNGLTRAERWTLTDLFGPVTKPGTGFNGPAALTCLKVGEVRRQIAKGATPKHTATEKEIRKWDVDAAMDRCEAERLHDNSLYAA